MLAVCLCLALLSCGLVHKTELVDIPLLSCSGLPCTEVSLDGSAPLRLFVDLASNSSYITAAAARRVKLAGISEARLRRDESTRSPRPTAANVNQIKIGSVVLRDRFFVVDPINALSLSSSPQDVLPPGDGALSYSAFSDRLFILDIPHHRLRISIRPYRKGSSPTGSRLIEVRTGDLLQYIAGSEGFAVNGQRTKAIIDPLYTGAVLAVEPIQRVLGYEGKPIGGSYRGDTLLFVRSVSVTFNGRTLSTSAPLVRADQGYGITGRQYDCVIGLSLLSTHAFAFDFRNMRMWLDDSA